MVSALFTASRSRSRLAPLVRDEGKCIRVIVVFGVFFFRCNMPYRWINAWEKCITFNRLVDAGEIDTIGYVQSLPIHLSATDDTGFLRAGFSRDFKGVIE